MPNMPPFDTLAEKILFIEKNYENKEAFYNKFEIVKRKSLNSAKAVSYAGLLAGSILSILGSVNNKFADSSSTVVGISWGTLALGSAMTILTSICKILSDHYNTDIAGFNDLLTVVDNDELGIRWSNPTPNSAPGRFSMFKQPPNLSSRPNLLHLDKMHTAEADDSLDELHSVI